MKLVKFFFTSFFILFSSISAQNINVSAYTDTTDYKVGDYITYTLDFNYDKDIRIIPPPVKDSVKILELIDSLSSQKKELNNKILETYKFIFSKYDSAEVTFPSYPVFYIIGSDTAKKSLYVNPVTITVHTLEVDPQKDIIDVKEPIKLPPNWLLIILLIIISLVIITLIYYLYQYFKKGKGSVILEKPETIIPPHEIAIEELRLLEEKNLWQSGKIKEYHSEITGIIRKYFERRFNFSALELTSPEILGCLSYLEEGKKILFISEQFFSNADLVKFAKFEPMPDINEEMMKQAYQIVNNTIFKLEPAEVQEGENV